MSATTDFDYLTKKAFKILYLEGSEINYFKAKSNDDCYQKAVKPDFILPDNTWIDFKLHVSYRESHHVAWRPSALYSSLRKYLDHSANKANHLTIERSHDQENCKSCYFKNYIKVVFSITTS
jgi:hypothetical protein